MGRRPCCEKQGLNRGAWTVMEDTTLANYISVHGEGKWRDLPLRAGLKRCGKSCRLRWLNYLRPNIKRGNITPDEDDLIIRLHRLLGNRWSLIAGRLPGRTDNEIKNYWNTNISKRFGPPTPALSFPQCHQDKPSVASTSCVIRTKARRCTKVILSKEFQDIHLLKHNKSMDTCENNAMLGAIEDNNVGHNSSSSDFIMDDQIFSAFMEADFSAFSDLDELIMSPLSNGNLLSNKEIENELDADWITSLLLHSKSSMDRAEVN